MAEAKMAQTENAMATRRRASVRMEFRIAAAPVMVVLAVLLALTLAPASAAAAATPPKTPAPAPLAREPQVHPNRTITFRLFAPNAKTVAVTGEWIRRGRRRGNKPTPMKRNSFGLWTVTVGPVFPEIYQYNFIVDGVSIVDPRNPWVKRSSIWGNTSLVEVRGKRVMDYDQGNVPHGAVTQRYFFSHVLGEEQPIDIYTPPHYDPSGKTRYPVLYLFHGYGDLQTAWVNDGRANFIADNAIAQGAKPMIIVMPLGQALPDPMRPFGVPPSSWFKKNLARESAEMTGDIIPWVQAHYPVLTGVNDRAIAGLSMGGGQALHLGLTRRDLFGYVAGFSSYLPGSGATAAAREPEKTSRNLQLLWLSVGRQDGLARSNEKLAHSLVGYGVPNVHWELSWGHHQWAVWRMYLGQLLPRLFQNATTPASVAAAR